MPAPPRPAPHRAATHARALSFSSSTSSTTTTSSASRPPSVLLFAPRSGRASVADGSAFLASLGATTRTDASTSSLADPRAPVARPPSTEQPHPCPTSLWNKIMAAPAPSPARPPSSGPIRSSDKAPRYHYTYAPSSRASRLKDKGKGKGRLNESGTQAPTPPSPDELLPHPATLLGHTCLPVRYILVLIWTVATSFLYLWNRHLFGKGDTLSILAATSLAPASDEAHATRMHRKLAFPPLLVSALQMQATSVLAAAGALLALALGGSTPSPSSSPRATTWVRGVLCLGVTYAAETALTARALQDVHITSVALGWLLATAAAVCVGWLPVASRAVPLLALAGASLAIDAVGGGLGEGVGKVWQNGLTFCLALVASTFAVIRWRSAQAILFTRSPAASLAHRSHMRVHPLLLTAGAALLASLGLNLSSWIAEPRQNARRTWHLLTGQWGEHGPPKRLPPIPKRSLWVPSTTAWAWLVLAFIPAILQTGAWASELALLKMAPLDLMVIYGAVRTVAGVLAAKLILDEDVPHDGTVWNWAMLATRYAQAALGVAIIVGALLSARRGPAGSERAPTGPLAGTAKVSSFGTFSSTSATLIPGDSPSTSAIKMPERQPPPAPPSAYDRQLMEEVNALSWDACGTTIDGNGIYDDDEYSDT